MNNSITKAINCSIVLFLANLSLVGMNIKKHQYDLARIKEDTLINAIIQFDTGNKKTKAEAEVALFSTLIDLQKKNLLTLIHETTLTQARKKIFEALRNRAFYNTALSFTDDLDDHQKIYTLMAHKEYKKGNFNSGMKYLKNKFDIQKKIDEHKKAAATLEKLIAQQHEQNIIKSLQLDPNNPDTLCILAGIYLSDNRVPLSYTTSLEYAKQAMISLTKTSIDTVMTSKYTMSLPITLKRLRNEPCDQTIQGDAAILQNYYDILSALKIKNNTRLQELSTIHKTKNTINDLPLQLLCSCIDESRLSALIENLYFNDPEFVALCTSTEKDIAIPALEWALCNLKLTTQEENLYHIILGGYEYNKSNFDAAVTHFKQYSKYDQDLYLQTLSLKVSKPELCQEKMTSLLPLLEKTLAATSHQENAKITQSKQIIAHACGYNSSTPLEEILLQCKQLFPLCAISPHNSNPFDYGYMLFAHNDLHKKSYMLSPQQQEEAKILSSYFTFFCALQFDNQKKIDLFLSEKNKNISKIRRMLLCSFRGNNKNDLQKIIFEDESFQQFCSSDGFIIEPILMQILDHPSISCKIKPRYCHYLLAGLASVQQQYDSAHHHFSQCNKNDPYVLAKLIEATAVNDILAPLKTYASLPTTAVISNKRKVAARQIINNILSTGKLIQAYTTNALENHNYENAYNFIECLMQLDIPETYSSLCNTFINLENNIIQLPTQEYQNVINQSYYINTYNSLQKIANEKRHNGYFCDCLSYILHKQIMHRSNTDEDELSIKKKCLHYLSCSLKHEVRIDAHQDKVHLCGNLAHHCGIIDESHNLLDLAIQYGNARALRSKASLLAYENRANTHDEIVKLLEKHINSDDEDAQRALSYTELGLYYSTQKGLKNQKKTFDYFKIAADLGNYQTAHLLAQFYNEGIEGYQDRDTQKALQYLNKNIELKQKDSYGDALSLRAIIYYNEGNYQQAEAYLEKVLALDYHDAQKLLAYWRIGLIKLQLLHEQSNLSQEIISHLHKAYTIAHEQKLIAPFGSWIQDLPLCNEEKTLNIVKKRIDYILKNNKIDNLSISFCAIMGAILLEQYPTTKPINEYRQCALSALHYAAQNNCAEAAFSLLNTTDDEVSRADIIYYLEMLPKNDPVLTHRIDYTLKCIYPAEIISQASLICSFAEKNNAIVLKQYIAQLYENHMPIAYDPICYTPYSHEEVKKFIQKCLQINIITESAAAFLKNPIKSIPLEHFSAIFLGSLLAYSQDSKELIKGASYLEASRKNFPTIQVQHIENNLGMIYYKLGYQAIQAQNKILALGFLEKGAELKNNRCLTALTQYVAANETSKKTIEVQSAPINLQKELEKFKKESDRQQQYPEYKRLVSQATNIFTQKDVEQSINTINQIRSFEDINKCNQPTLCLQYAMVMFNSPDNINSDKITQLVQKAIAHGIIQDASSKSALFKNDIILEILCKLIEAVIKKNNTKYMTAFLPNIKKELIRHGIDIKTFESYYQSAHKIKLAQNYIWKKAK